MKLTGYGKREWLGGAVIAVLIEGAAYLFLKEEYPIIMWIICGVVSLIWLALAAFFRVPNRKIPVEDNVLLSPADGVVKDIGVVSDHEIELFKGQKLMRVGIFLSVLDVHVNRAPCDMTVEYRKYKEGFFHDARSPLCEKENESLVIAGTGTADGKSFPVAVRQVSGAIARRIVCDPEPGANLKKGAIYGMIKFGSRTELFFPVDDDIHLVVQEGAIVRSGTTIFAKVNHKGVNGK